jgi:Ca-activated chloride channel homolog
MVFQWASMLWLLLLLPMLVMVYLWAQRRRRKYAVRFASLMLVKDAMARGPGFRRHVPAILFLLGVAVGLLALARPQAAVSLPSNRGTVILAIDISGSMRARDIAPSRFEAAKEAAREFVQKQPPRVRIGVVAFSGTAALVQAPTTSREDILASLDRLRLQRGTAIGSGLLIALDAIFEDDPRNQPAPPGTDPLVAAQPAPEPDPVPAGSNQTAVVVLLTDGQNNQGPDPIDAADKAASRGIRVFTVGIGSARGDILGIEGRSFHVGLDEDSLKRIARGTAAQYFKAENEDQLVGIYRTLGTRLIVGKDQTEVTVLFTAVATGVILLGALLSLLWFNRML